MRIFAKGMSEAEFASRWQEGKNKMYRFAYCYVKNEHDAMEIVSEATYKAFLSLEKLREPEYFDSWMGQIIIRTAIDYLKKQKRLVFDEDRREEESGVVDLDLYQQAETRMDVFAALELITPEERGYVVLKYFEEKSFLEIAEMMGVPEATVKTKVYRSLKKMRRYWKSMEDSIC